LRTLKENEEIEEANWVSQENAYSPYDFLISKGNTNIFIEVKSTKGNFESEIHISLNQLEEISCDTKIYHIYRIFQIDEESKTAKLRIAEDVRNFAKKILEVFKSLDSEVKVDSISVSPLNAKLNFSKEEIIELLQEEIKEIELLQEEIKKNELLNE
jgi:hypothetical protein